MRVLSLGVFLSIANFLIALVASSPASAAENDAPEAPPPVVKLERIPPRVSYELGVQMTYAAMPQFRDDSVPPWPGIGMRGAGGRNFGLHRIGGGGSISIEGPAPEFFTLALEPFGAWDYVAESGFALGASIGPSLLLHNRLELSGTDRTLALAPTVAFRVGWSQTWSRVGRRVHFYLEPKLRVQTNGDLVPVASLVVGSGRGR